MLTTNQVVGAVWLGMAMAVWLMLVPDGISPAGFLWINVAMVSLVAVTVGAARNARATRSIAHVLHDVEHPKVKP